MAIVQGSRTELDVMDLITPNQYERLIANFNHHIDYKDQIPIVHLFARELDYHWLISELDPFSCKAYGLYETEDRKPVLGVIDLNAITELRENGKSIFNDISFYTNYKIAVFHALSLEIGQLVIAEDGLENELEAIKLRLENLEL